MPGHRDLKNKNERRRTILLAENDVALARLNSGLLENLGYSVITAHSGEEAIKATRTNLDIDLVLIDIELGKGIDGAEAAQQILTIRELPIVFLTAHTTREYVARVSSITRFGLIVKNSGEFVLESSLAMAFELFETRQQALMTQKQFEATLNALPDLLLELDRNGVCLDFHSPVGEACPLIDGDYVGRSIKETMPADSVEIIMSAVAEAENKLVSFGKEFRFFSGDKSRWYEISVAKKAISPQQSNYIVLQRDITKRKRTEESLRTHQVELEVQTEEVRAQQAELEGHRYKYFNLYEFSPVGIIGFSDGGFINEINLTAALQFQSTRNSLAGQPITKLINPADQDTFYLARRRLIARQSDVTAEPRETFSLALERADKTLFTAFVQLSLSRTSEARQSFCLVILPFEGAPVS